MVDLYVVAQAHINFTITTTIVTIVAVVIVIVVVVVAVDGIHRLTRAVCRI